MARFNAPLLPSPEVMASGRGLISVQTRITPPWHSLAAQPGAHGSRMILETRVTFQLCSPGAPMPNWPP